MVRGHEIGTAGRLVEPVVEVDLGAFAQVRAEAALAAQSGQLAGARSGDHEPVAADDAALDRARVLEQERAGPAAHGSGDPLDPDEAGRPVGARGLQELDDAVTGDVPGEALLDVRSEEHTSEL